MNDIYTKLSYPYNEYYKNTQYKIMDFLQSYNSNNNFVKYAYISYNNEGQVVNMNNTILNSIFNYYHTKYHTTTKYINPQNYMIPERLRYSFRDWVILFPYINYTKEEINLYNDIMKYYNNVSYDITSRIRYASDNEKQTILEYHNSYYEDTLHRIIKLILKGKDLENHQRVFFIDNDEYNLSLNNILIMNSPLDIDRLRFTNLFTVLDDYDMILQNYKIIEYNHRIYTVTKVDYVDSESDLPLFMKFYCFSEDKVKFHNCLCCGHKFRVFPYNKDQQFCSWRCSYAITGTYYDYNTYNPNTGKFNVYSMPNKQYISIKDFQTRQEVLSYFINHGLSIKSFASSLPNTTTQNVYYLLYTYGIPYKLRFDPDIRYYAKYFSDMYYNKIRNFRNNLAKDLNIATTTIYSWEKENAKDFILASKEFQQK